MVFVPLDPEEEMNEKQKSILQTFPAEDMGKVLQDEDYEKKGYGKEVKN
jgi:hypothetical protein